MNIYYIIIFTNGTYFNGVKGKMVRSTKNILDAKRIDNGIISDRDLTHLARFKEHSGYRLAKVKATFDIRFDYK